MSTQNSRQTIDLIPTWSKFRPLGNSFIVRLSALVPIIGYFIIFNNYLVANIHLAEPIVPKSADITPSLYRLFFGLSFVGLGSVVYALFCPQQISYYGTSSSYVRGDGPSFRDVSFEQIRAALRNSRYRNEYEALRAKTAEGAVYIRSREDHLKAIEDDNTEYLHMHFKLLDSSYWFARLAVAFSYFVGITFLAYSACVVFYRVAAAYFTLPWSVLFGV